MSRARVLVKRLAELLDREHASMADFLLALADFDRRRLWMEMGYASLFIFLHRELALSKGAAHYRACAARLLQRFPEIIEPLRDGRLCLSSIAHLAKVLTPENRQETLPKFFHRSKQEAMIVAASIQPIAAPSRDVVTRVAARVHPDEPAGAASTPAEVSGGVGVGAVHPVEPGGAGPVRGADSSGAAVAVHPVEPGSPGSVSGVDASGAAASVHPGEPGGSDSAGGTDATSAAAAVHPIGSGGAGPASVVGPSAGAGGAPVHPVEPPTTSASFVDAASTGTAPSAQASAPAVRPDSSRRLDDVVQPLTAELSRIHITVSARFLRKLEAAKSALSHTHPWSNRSEAVLETALDLLLERYEKRRGLVKNPRPGNADSTSDDIPAAVKRHVWTRDKGQCQWPLESGGICASTYRPQFGHKVARALGGRPTAKNLRVVCAFHNDLEARQVFGDAWMDRFTRNPAGPSPPKPRA